MLNAHENDRTLTFYQPWATLIAEGLKTVEATQLPAEPEMIGQRLRIRASANPYADGITTPTRRLMDRALQERGWRLTNLPRGVVVGDVRLTGCFKAASDIVRGRISVDERVEGSPGRVESIFVGHRDFKFGSFVPGRWIWQFSEPCPLKNWDTGTVKFFDNARGYGFIQWGEVDVLVNFRVRNASGVAMLPGREVRFRAEETDKGLRALELAECII